MSKSKSMCSGCRDDFYNKTVEGGCWNFKNAKIVKRVRVGTWQNPPYDPALAKDVLDCYHAEGSCMLPTSDCRMK